MTLSYNSKKQPLCLLLVYVACLSLGLISSPSKAQGDGHLRLIVTFEAAHEGLAKAAVRRGGGQILRHFNLVDAVSISFPASGLGRLQATKGVLRVEADSRVFAVGKPERCSPWPACKNAGDEPEPPPPENQTTPWGVSKTKAPLVWQISRGEAINVAVIDTGIDQDHPDLSSNIGGGVNFVSKPYWKPADPNKWDDDNGHGTHVAGTIAALDNGVGVVGVAPDSVLYGIKVLDRNGSGYVSDVIAGIDWAAANGMNVINMSLGSPSDVQALHDAVDAAYAAGLVIVAAAGNSGDGNAATNNVGYPAKYDSVIAVAATDSNNNVAYFSSDGDQVELAAPGVSILSTVAGGGYGESNGTSMASPHVAGVAALVLATPVPEILDSNANGLWDPNELRQNLNASALDLGVPLRDPFFGFGLVDAEGAL